MDLCSSETLSQNKKEKINLTPLSLRRAPGPHLPVVLTVEPHSAHGQFCWGLDVHVRPLQNREGSLLSGHQSRRRGLGY